MQKCYYLFLIFFPLYAAAQESDSAWIVNHYLKKEQYIPMRDKVNLFTSIYQPTDSTVNTHPILLLRTPYSCAPYGKAWIPFWKVYVKAYLKEGYIVVFQDVRGKYMSEGDFVNIRPYNPDKKSSKDIDEASDAYDTIDWLVKNVPGNNGKVGTLGTSYLGYYALMTGLSGHPALKAISPQAPVTDWFVGDDVHHNGAFMLQDMFEFFAGSFGVTRPKPRIKNPEGVVKSTDDAYTFYLRTGPLPDFTKMADAKKAFFWHELMEHPDYDKWWQDRNDRKFVSRIPTGTASLVVGSQFDAEDCFGAINLYKAIDQGAKNTNKFVFGPWYHGQWGSDDGYSLGNINFGVNTSKWYQDKIELPFFNYYLKGEGNADSIARASVFFTGENQWHKLNQWPPRDVQQTNLYLQKHGKLDFNKPTGNGNYEQYISDPAKPVPYTDGISNKRTVEYMDDDQRFASSRTDVLTFETDTLTKDLTLAGPVTADLLVSISTTDDDFVVKLIDVFPDNFKYSEHDKYIMNSYEMLVRGDIFRGRYRNSFSKPEPFVPGKITEVKYTLNDVAHTFKKGHRVMVQVQSSWFPLADRNPQQFLNIYHAKNSDFIKSAIKVYMSAAAASKITLPVVLRGSF